MLRDHDIFINIFSYKKLQYLIKENTQKEISLIVMR